MTNIFYYFVKILLLLKNLFIFAVRNFDFVPFNTKTKRSTKDRIKKIRGVAQSG